MDLSRPAVDQTERLTGMTENTPSRARAGRTLPFLPHDRMPIIAFAGDWHEGPSGLFNQFRTISNLGVRHVHHVGHFDLQPERPGRTFIDQVNDVACQFNLWITVTPGTRSDWRYLAAIFEAVGAGNPAHVRSRIVALPRGCRWIEGDRSFLSYGGSSPQAFEYHSLDEAWSQDVADTLKEFDTLIADGHADVMLANDSPVPGTPGVNQLRSNPPRSKLDAFIHAAYGAEGITAAWTEASPDILIHGHYNLGDETTLPGGQRIFSLASGGNAGHVLTLDLRTMKPTWLEDADK